MRRRTGISVAVVVTLALALSCKRAQTGAVRIDSRKALAEVTTRINHGFSRPAGAAAYEVLFGKLATNAPLVGLGDRLFATLSQDPRCVAGTAHIFDPLTESKQLATLVESLIATQSADVPGAVGAKVRAGWSSATIAAGADAAFSSLLAQVSLSSSALATSTDLDNLVMREFSEPNRVAAWSQKLIALNGGTPPDSERATQLFVNAIASSERIDQFLGKLVSVDATANAAAAFLVQALSDPNIAKQIVNSACELLDDPQLQADMLQIMLELLEQNPNATKVVALQKKIFAGPTVVRQVQKVSDVIMASPAATAAIAAALAGLVSDPQPRAVFDWFLDDWK